MNGVKTKVIFSLMKLFMFPNWGNSLSPFSAEIFMDRLESQIYKQPFINNALYWYRYDDDVF